MIEPSGNIAAGTAAARRPRRYRSGFQNRLKQAHIHVQENVQYGRRTCRKSGGSLFWDSDPG